MSAQLYERMRALAKDHPRASELIEKADALEAAAKGYWSEPQTVDVRKFLGCVARAKLLWCEITGEDLI